MHASRDNARGGHGHKGTGTGTGTERKSHKFPQHDADGGNEVHRKQRVRTFI
jgi:hypothetical protein